MGSQDAVCIYSQRHQWPARPSHTAKPLSAGRLPEAQSPVSATHCFVYHTEAVSQVLVGLNKRDSKVFDMHRIDIASGQAELDTENPGEFT